jgi:hypothetical protein
MTNCPVLGAIEKMVVGTNKMNKAVDFNKLFFMFISILR